ncbi:MAG TPA: prolipoprotein diacylglyceryl transferase family protein [Geobacteraceae bacterium]|nr:prolipoprotein diacylglyceryl transferase family protein [Geobacteraceae bacterium]
MVDNYLFIAGLGIFCMSSIWWGTKRLPGENWQFFASIPVRKRGDGTWEAINITWYGLLVAGANVFAALIFFVMLGAVGVPFAASVFVLLTILLICVPAAGFVAQIVERKQATLTVGGAVFVGSIAAPFLIILINLVSRWLVGFVLPLPQTLAACAVAFLFGEGLGRLACLSYGCCYGKPVEEYEGILRQIFERTALVFYGKSKKIAYASGLEGRKIVPVQPVTMTAYVIAGMATLYLYAGGHCLAAYVTASIFASFWRVFSELFRADFRGGGRITAYQVMAGVSALYSVGVAVYLRNREVFIPGNLPRGAASLWSPGPIIALLAIWLIMVVFAGISTTTFSRVEFFLHEDRV